MKTQETVPNKKLNPVVELAKLLTAAGLVYAVSWSVMGLERELLARLDGLTVEAQAREYVAPRPQPGIKDFVAEISQANGVETKLVEAIIDQESGWRGDAMRFEPGVAERFRERGVRDDEITALSTSFGLMQIIYGYHRELCGLRSATDLFDARVNIACGVRVFKKCFSKSNDVRRALVCYNGAEEYADEVLKRLANKMVG